MRESHELYSRIIDAVGAKRLANAMGLSLSHTYRLARHPMDVDNADGTGARNDLDRFEQVVDLLAARRTARPVLVELRCWFEALFNRALGESQGGPLTHRELRAKAVRALHETADLIDACCEGKVERTRVLSEAIEARDVLDRIIASLDHELVEDEDEDPKGAPRDAAAKAGEPWGLRARVSPGGLR